MLILSNALSDTPDEGSLKVAVSLTQRIKASHPEVTVVSWERTASCGDVHLKLNKLLLNGSLIRLLRQRREPVLYLPFPTRALPMAARLFLLSHLCPAPVTAVLPLTRKHGFLSRWLLGHCSARLAVLSQNSQAYYAAMVEPDRVLYLKTGVDTRRFVPVSPEQKRTLKARYGLNPEQPVLLHVGHLKRGRNLHTLAQVEGWQILLVVSTFTEPEQELRQQLEKLAQVTILDRFLPDMQEVYQLADAYFFPVTAEHNCIDVPLSCLEAAACGLPVITTAYGEMAELLEKPGFYPVPRDPDSLSGLLNRLPDCRGESRASVLPYDWKHAAARLWEWLS